jgi:hypothetical protein
LNDTVAAYFDELKTLTAEKKDLWNYDLYAPLLFVRRESGEIFANAPDSGGVLKKNGSIFTGLLPASVNIANTAMRWNGVDWAMVMLPLPEERNDRLTLLVHELFHSAQPHLGFKLYNTDNNHLDQKDGRIYLRLELEALKAALLADSVDERMKHITDALEFRLCRYSKYPHADSTENLLELNEGIAEYTGIMTSQRNEQELRTHFVNGLNQFLTNPTFVRSFAYQTIPLYGCLLHRMKSNWNRDITSGTNLTGYFLHAFNVHVPQDFVRAASAVTDKYHGQTIIAEETTREEKILKRMAEYKNIFIELSHLDIPLRNMNVAFDPRNIMPLENKGTVYPNLRITDEWGILTVTKGALMSPAWNKVTVSSPTKIEEEKILGDGWTLELKNGFIVQKADANNNYILRNK